MVDCEQDIVAGAMVYEVVSTVVSLIIVGKLGVSTLYIKESLCLFYTSRRKF